MTDRKMSNFELATLNYFLTRAFLIGVIFNALVNILKQDSWVIPIISILPALILIALISYIMEYKPDLNISQKVIVLFNSVIGRIILIIIVLYTFFTSIINFLNMGMFIQSQFLNKTPLISILILFMLTTFMYTILCPSSKECITWM